MASPIPTSVRRLTPAVSSAIAAIEIAGPLALELVSQALFTSSGKPVRLNLGQVRFALWRFEDRQLADEHVMVLVRDAETVEVHCHGGLAVTEQVIQQLQLGGCGRAQTLATWDSSQSASSASDPLSVESVHQAAEAALCQAATLKTSLVLLDQYQGALSREIVRIHDLLHTGQTALARDLVEQLLARSAFGLRLLSPWRITLAGPPNAGKSSLLNAVCGAARVLVHHEPGTTRDAIETNLVIGGWPVKLIDTAGIRESNEAIERQGIETAQMRWAECDIGLLVVDATIGWTEAHSRLLSGPQQVVVVINKIDALNSQGPAAIRLCIDQVRHMIEQNRHSERCLITISSAVQPGGLEQLLQCIGNYLDGHVPPADSGVPFTTEQVQALRHLLANC